MERNSSCCPSCYHYTCGMCEVYTLKTQGGGGSSSSSKRQDSSWPYPPSSSSRPAPSSTFIHQAAVPIVEGDSTANPLLNQSIFHSQAEAKPVLSSFTEGAEASKDQPAQLSDPTHTSSTAEVVPNPILEQPQLLATLKGLPTGIDLPHDTTVRRRPGGHLEEQRQRGQSAPNSQRDPDPEQDPSGSPVDLRQSTQSNPSRQTLQGSGDPDSDPSRSVSFTFQGPKRLPLWLIWAIIICISIGLISLVVRIPQHQHQPTHHATAVPS